MTAEIVVSDPHGLAIDNAYTRWLASHAKTTREAYLADARTFAAFVGVPTPEAFRRLLLNGRGPGNALVRDYKNALVAQDLAAATINRRLAAIRSFAQIAFESGACEWTITVEGMRVEARRDSKGPPWTTLAKVIEAEPSTQVRAMLCLMGHAGARINEVLTLNLVDIAPDYRSARLLGKGQRERETHPLSDVAGDALALWIKERGRTPGRVFDTSYASARRWIKAAGARVGIPLRPHGLRHTALTRALDATGGDVRSVRFFSRHESIDVLLRIYDDANALEVAAAVAAKVSAP